jgi:hypothetical protein
MSNRIEIGSAEEIMELSSPPLGGRWRLFSTLEDPSRAEEESELWREEKTVSLWLAGGGTGRAPLTSHDIYDIVSTRPFPNSQNRNMGPRSPVIMRI